ncbi:hypothetical protein PISMIDRAFT_688713 [Pisolithus microcarpus 441]|uniref:Uncharacterized protein n=1 Tax=Pisolithus microcarpus 441 TaxID=765257 RepID=A0A0C9XLW4_9AGAM|nr:hypothetical protein PISMIDRAFT_688713 [Pisolithus microcarpus 441]
MPESYVMPDFASVFYLLGPLDMDPLVLLPKAQADITALPSTRRRTSDTNAAELSPTSASAPSHHTAPSYTCTRPRRIRETWDGPPMPSSLHKALLTSR